MEIILIISCCLLSLAIIWLWKQRGICQKCRLEKESVMVNTLEGITKGDVIEMRDSQGNKTTLTVK